MIFRTEDFCIRPVGVIRPLKLSGRFRLEAVTRTSGANVSCPAITGHSTTGVTIDCLVVQSALSGDAIK